MDTIILHGKEVSRVTLVRFKKLYMEALQKEKTLFVFDGQEVLTSYAKYVVEYAENSFGTLK